MGFLCVGSSNFTGASRLVFGSFQLSRFAPGSRDVFVAHARLLSSFCKASRREPTHPKLDRSQANHAGVATTPRKTNNAPEKGLFKEDGNLYKTLFKFHSAKSIT